MNGTYGAGRPDFHQRYHGYGPRQPGFDLRDAFESLFADFERRARPRVWRGDLRAAILTLLDDEPMHGYQIIQEIDKRTDGEWKPSPRSVYPTPQLLADEGLIRAEEVEGKNIYSLTEAGNDQVKTSGPAPWEAAGGRNAARSTELPRAAAKLAPAVAQITHGGTPEQIRDAVAILDEARRNLYKILAQD